jgi:DNA-binding response OmpR family regulator
MNAPLPSAPSTNLKNVPERLSVIWLRHADIPFRRVRPLVNTLSSSGLDVWLLTPRELPLEQVLCFDLIVLEASSSNDAPRDTEEIVRMLRRIRLGSRAPLLLLSESTPMQWRIQALRAGADAILPLDTAPSVVLAQCRAMCRRWRPAS